MRLVVISDTHGAHRELTIPAGDVLIHAGDVSNDGRTDEIQDFVEWFDGLPHANKLLIAGNHDRFIETNQLDFLRSIRECSFKYLQDSGIALNGVKFWGSPMTPRFYDWAFMLDPGAAMREHWRSVPTDTDVLITHGPPRNILDAVWNELGEDERAGCCELADLIKEVEPSLHLFGHIHESYGDVTLGATRHVNASVMNHLYELANAAVVIDY